MVGLLAPNAIGLTQRLVDGPYPTGAWREVRSVAGAEFKALSLLGHEGRAPGNEVTELRVDDRAREPARRRLPGAGGDVASGRGKGLLARQLGRCAAPYGRRPGPRLELRARD